MLCWKATSCGVGRGHLHGHHVLSYSPAPRDKLTAFDFRKAGDFRSQFYRAGGRIETGIEW